MSNSFAETMVVALAGILLAGCANPTRLESDMHGDLKTTLVLDKPLQMNIQMQGPTVRYEGTYVSDELLERVQVGKTPSEWLIAVFGEPDAKHTMPDQSEIWRWTYRPIEQQTSMVELFSKSDKEPKLAARSVLVVLRGGVAVEKWKG